MTTFVVLLAPAGLGALALRGLGLRWRDDPVGACAWAWLLGCLVLGVCVQIGLELHAPPAWWWVPVVVAAAGLAIAGRRRPVAAPAAVPPPRDRAFVGFVIAGAALCLLFVVAGLDRPCIEGDEGNIWSLKAKSLLVDWPAGFAAAQVHNLHPDYPQLDPLLQAWAYAWHGGPPFDPFAARLPVQLGDVALFLATAAALRRRLRALPAALLASLLLFEPEFHALLRTAYADGMVALGLVVAVDAWLRRAADPDSGRRWSLLSGCGFAFALWSKNETMLYAASAVCAALLLRIVARGSRPRRSVAALLPLAPPLLVIAGNSLWNRRFGMHSDLFGANPTGKSMFALAAEQWRERLPVLLAEFGRAITSSGHAHVMFAALLLGAVMQPARVLRSAAGLPLLALLGSLLGLHAVYVGSFLPLRFHLDTSYLRVTFQLLPPALVLAAALASGVVAARPAGHTDGAP